MNQTERYRLEALIELASVYPGARPSAEVAARRRIPAAYLSQLLAELGRSGLVRSRRGPGGGVALAAAPEHIPVTAVVAPWIVGDGPLPPALERLSGIVAAAVEGAVADLDLADLLRWERRAAEVADYSI